LACAAGHAHKRGIIHRDLKPGNVLLASTGDCSEDPGKQRSPLTQLRPRIADFGLARRLDGGLGTASGTILGTPFYMAPEQASGKTRELGPEVDVHGLGVMLYELLTGKRPFDGDSLLDVLKQVRDARPVPPRQRRADIPEKLETICLRCLTKSPEMRYPDAL